MTDGLEIEQRMLTIDKNKVVPGRLGNAGDIAGTPEPHRHSERNIAGLHARLHRVDESIRGRRHRLNSNYF
jgi:hypothetical protein